MSREDIANKSWLNASSFRIILSVSLLLILVLSSLGFTYAHRLLGRYADDIAHKKIDASASDDRISSLRKVQETMEQNQSLIDKIDSLRAKDSFPEIAIIDRVKAIAKRNDIKIDSFALGSSSQSASTDGDSAQPGIGQQPPTAATPGASNDTVSLTINIGSVPSYRKYLQFIYDIEQNVPKMRIKGVGVSGNNGDGNSTTDGSNPASQESDSSGGVSVDPLIIEMYKKAV